MAHNSVDLFAFAPDPVRALTQDADAYGNGFTHLHDARRQLESDGGRALIETLAVCSPTQEDGLTPRYEALGLMAGMMVGIHTLRTMGLAPAVTSPHGFDFVPEHLSVACFLVEDNPGPWHAVVADAEAKFEAMQEGERNAIESSATYFSDAAARRSFCVGFCASTLVTVPGLESLFGDTVA